MDSAFEGFRRGQRPFSKRRSFEREVSAVNVRDDRLSNWGGSLERLNLEVKIRGVLRLRLIGGLGRICEDF